ncbi:MAG TPA: hypothetical protein VHE35_07090 [Kofleriaceae bacterium]|nr:hypothetical protein [Kofleriaceae bacterium]
MVRLTGAVVACTVACTAAVAHAGPEEDAPSARSIGHAGAALVSDDGLGALFECPAGLGRRGELRAQLGGAVIDDDVRFSDGSHPVVADHGPASLVPTAVAAGTLGPFVIGAGFAVTETVDRRLPAPGPDDDPAIAALYPHRYAGTEARWSRRALALAASWRATDWLAIGAGATLAQVDLRESRRLWVGFDGRDALGDPARDATIELRGGDGLVPGGTIGALIAPASVPLELALGASWADDVRVTGDATVTARGPFSVVAPAPRTAARFGSPLALHAGARWLGDRYAVEADVSGWLYPTTTRPWQLTGVRFVDESGVDATLDHLASRFQLGRRLAARAAVDVEALPGWLWVTAGYAYATVDEDRAAITTATVDPGGHTLALGLEVSAGNATITLGVARRLDRVVAVGAGDGGLDFDNPFPGGAAPANLGRHGQSRDELALAVELALP